MSLHWMYACKDLKAVVGKHKVWRCESNDRETDKRLTSASRIFSKDILVLGADLFKSVGIHISTEFGDQMFSNSVARPYSPNLDASLPA